MPNPETLISEEKVLARVNELASQISLDYADKGEIVLIGVLKGAFIFLADLPGVAVQDIQVAKMVIGTG